MAHWIDDLEELCEKVTDEIAEANKKIRTGNGKLSAGDVEYLDKLTHMLKSIKTTIAMGEYDDDRSGNYRYDRRNGRSYDGDMDGGSYARGRGRNAKRDSMGRYSSERGYSRNEAVDDVKDAIHEAMDDMPEHLKREARNFLNKIEQM